MPAFGAGRSIMDVISINPNAKIIANDLQDTRNILSKLLIDYGYSDDKIVYLIGDIMDRIEELEDGSVDVIYTPNLFHFLSPFKTRNLLCEFNRVLKPQGKLFISWKEIDDINFQKLSKTLENWRIPYPRYVDNDYLSLNNRQIILPYNSLSINDMEKHAEKAQLLVVKSGVEYPVACKMNNLIVFGEYRFEEEDTFNAVVTHKFMILEKLLTDNSTTKITVDEYEYFEKRKDLITKKINDSK